MACLAAVGESGCVFEAVAPCDTGGSSGITIGTTTITGGTDTRVLFDDGGVVGEDAGFTYNKTTDLATLGGGLEITNSAIAVSSANSVRLRSSGGVLQVSENGAAYVNVVGGGLSIGASISGGTATRILYEGAGPVLADDADLTWDDSTLVMTIGAGGSIVVNSDADLNPTATFGRIRLFGDSDNAYFSHFDKNTTQNFALRQSSSGDSTLNCQSTRSVTITATSSVGMASFRHINTSNPAISFTGTATTNQTAGTEVLQVDFDYGVAYTHASNNAITTQRCMRVEAPTYAFASAGGVITSAVTVEVENCPVQGTNATIEDFYAFRAGTVNTTLGATNAGLTYAAIATGPCTLTVTGSTGVTSAQGITGVSIFQITVTDASAVTIDQSASLYIAGAPIAAGSVTITNPYAIFSDAGLNRFDGDGSHVFELPADATGNASAATGRIPVKVGGATVYLRYYAD